MRPDISFDLCFIYGEGNKKFSLKEKRFFTSCDSLWSATEGWISVTENIATSNPLQERRLGMKTGSPARLLREKHL